MKVLHLVRKNTQLKASFICNQINSHLVFEPCIVFRENRIKENDGGFAEFNLEKYDCLDLSLNESRVERFLFKTIKILSKRQIKNIRKFINKNNVQICHFHYGTDCGVFFPLIKKLGIPCVVSFYGYDCSSFPYYMRGYGRRYLANRVFKLVDAVLAMSPDMKKDLMKAGCPEQKIIIHYYGTDTEKFFHQRNHLPKENLIILILASLVPQKGHLFLLKSIKHLYDSGVKNFQLRIVGTGESENELKDFVTHNHLEKNVLFIGAIPYASKQMQNEYNNADIFVHPSIIAPNGDKEGIPGTIVEAMSAGLPVISTFHAGIPFIIENGKTGLLVTENDVFALSEAIKKLIDQPDLRQQLSVDGQNYACKFLDLRNKERELEKIYSIYL
jgi:colanic acid/amylovoran biosynthesis glycosyltransferase